MTGLPGEQSHVTRSGRWRVSTRKQPILKAEPIEALSSRIGIPIPEMIFGDNNVTIEHTSGRFAIQFNAGDALDCVSKTSEGMLQVAIADAWKKDREHNDDVKQVVKPFDWSYSTSYKGTTQASSGSWQASTPAAHPIRADLLSRPDPILFFDSVDLYEDELADNGIGILSVKIRVMPERTLLLSRFFLRLDGVIVRLRDTRVYIEHDSNLVIRQYSAKEESYDVLQEKLRVMMRGDSVSEALRDPNNLAPLLRTIEETTEVFDVH